jgi:DNA-binding GntR family transcriptional regulator
VAMKLASLKPSNLGNQAYNSIAEALMKGSLHAGERLRIRSIAQDLGTSVTPVRDAILRLVQDEALIMRNSRDIRVPAISADEYMQIRNIRIELEGLAAERAATVATAQDVARLEALVRDNEAAIKRRDYALGTELNQVFHAELAVIGQTPVLLGVLRRLWVRIGPLLSDSYAAGGRTMVEHHYAIVDAIKRHDPQLARASVRQDILEGSTVVAEAMKDKTGRQQRTQPNRSASRAPKREVKRKPAPSRRKAKTQTERRA